MPLHIRKLLIFQCSRCFSFVFFFFIVTMLRAPAVCWYMAYVPEFQITRMIGLLERQNKHTLFTSRSVAKVYMHTLNSQWIFLSPSNFLSISLPFSVSCSLSPNVCICLLSSLFYSTLKIKIMILIKFRVYIVLVII